MCDTSLLQPVVDRSIELLAQRLHACGNPRVDTVYIGGGTPTLLPTALLRRLLVGIAAAVGPTVREWTIEANPDTIDRRLLNRLSDSGVTRLSIGVQSFQPRLLRLLGRRCRTVELDEVLGTVAGCWTGQWSIDLISGILDQSLLEAVDDAERACGFGPQHVSLYDLSVEPATPLAQRLASAGACGMTAYANRAAQVSAAAARALQQRGYRRYEISSYSRAGAESRHNCGYWAMHDYIGVGPAAVSALRQADGSVIRYSDPADIAAFAESDVGKHCWGAAERVNGQVLVFEMLMLGLRTAIGVAVDDVDARLDRQRAAAVALLLQRWCERGDAQRSAGRLCMTSRGWDTLDFCLRELSTAIGLS